MTQNIRRKKFQNEFKGNEQKSKVKLNDTIVSKTIMVTLTANDTDAIYYTHNSSIYRI